MNTPKESTGGCCPPQPCSVVSYILQELNDDDAMNPYWYDDLQPKGTKTTEKKCRAYVTEDMRRNPRHYEVCRHRIVRREETEIPFPNAKGEAQPPAKNL